MRKTVLTYLACIVVLVLVACPLLIRDFMQAAQTLPQDTAASQDTQAVSASSAQQDTQDTQALAGTAPQRGQADTGAVEAEWKDTGALHDDGTPMLAAQGDTAQRSGVTDDAADEIPAPCSSYVLTLDLDGGQVNDMRGYGWNRSSVQATRWTRTVTETQAGQGVTLKMDETLGALLSRQPYRAGYRFTGWQIDGVSPGADEAFTLTADTVIAAGWQAGMYSASFRDSEGQLWSVRVPYGATLWTDAQTPWTADGVVWSQENTAKVDISAGGMTYGAVTVTRHMHDASQSYYYTFRLADTAYFTYGGPVPQKAGQHFTSWKLMGGGTGFTVTQDAVFTAQFRAENMYVFNVYFLDENGVRMGNTVSVQKSAADVENGRLTFFVEIPAIAHYTAQAAPQTGVSWDGGTVSVDVEAAFGDQAHSAATNFLALTVTYRPARITYTVQYYQQQPGGGMGYTKVGTLEAQSAAYASRVAVLQNPDLGSDVRFDGFEVRADCWSAVHEGVVLRQGTPNVGFDADGNATIRVYYDRASYFIYMQTGTAEVQIDPVKVRYGEPMPSLQTVYEKLTRAGYRPVAADNVSWYRLDDAGELVSVAKDTGGTMPAHDLYAVVTWVPDKTCVRLVYWVESRNAASFQNAYTVTVEGVSTEAALEVRLDGGVRISGAGWPDAVDGAAVAEKNFDALMRSRYGDAAYADFFAYSPQDTRESPGNVANAQATGTGGVSDGAITQEEYTVRVNGDGTTTINLYYTRNLYTLSFILARENGGTLQVATGTPGTFEGSAWTNAGNAAFAFTDFGDGVTASDGGGQTYASMRVQRIYRLTQAMDRDPRAAVGRYGTRTIRAPGPWWSGDVDYNCHVYTVTARFEADISALWPTVDNIAGSYGGCNYISMGTDSGSYYRNVFTLGSNQKNILNVYSTMDQNVTASGKSETSWTAAPDDGSGTVTHQMVAYWAMGAQVYRYHFLYEALDTTVSAEDADIPRFEARRADAGAYADGQYVSWNAGVFVYDADFSVQYSTSTLSGQNQPSHQGFVSRGKAYDGPDTAQGGDVYFFYERELYTLDIQNVEGRYQVSEALLTQEFSCLSGGASDTGTLARQGWVRVNADGTASIRYGGALWPLSQTEVIDWLTAKTGGGLAYPYQSAGENQYYFWRWYKNPMQTVPIDWSSDNEMQRMLSNNTLYAGWFTPRYTTTYALNGGVWQDNIDYTLTSVTGQDGETILIYYPHRTQDAAAPLYWYVQSKPDDRLFVDTLYTCQVGQVAVWSQEADHWVGNGRISTVEELLQISQIDLQGSRLIDRYYCYMGQEGAYNHERYVSVNAAVNTVLEEPAKPVRTGYAFGGWFYFDDAPQAGTRVYLQDVLTGMQSLASYDEGYVYRNHVGDAFLLHRDENGALFYYPAQTGYRYSYANDASVVASDRILYAAWEPQGDANAVIYHLVEKEASAPGSVFTPKDGEVTQTSETNTITIGQKTYYVLGTQEQASLYTGSTYTYTAWEYATDGAGTKWLPRQAQIDLFADERTQTVAKDDLSAVRENTWRVAYPDGTYTYYAFFLYQPTDEVVYNVHAIDLAVAVASGALDSYEDTFDRSFRISAAAPYLLQTQQLSMQIDGAIDTTYVTQNAPPISGYTVYEDFSQSLQLQTDASSNNIFFYYVSNDAKIHYNITFYRMRGGAYSPENQVRITGIPASTGQIISLFDMTGTLQRLVNMAGSVQAYAGSADAAQRDLYERYKKMSITCLEEGAQTSFHVDASLDDTLALCDLETLWLDCYVDGWSPTGETLVVSDGAEVEVYLADAQLIVQKTDTDGIPLAGAQFLLERLVADTEGTIAYEGVNYAPDPSFSAVTVSCGEDGRAVFCDLSARVFADGKGYLYRLTETQAPAGYQRLDAPMYVQTPYTVQDTVSYAVTYTVVNAGVSYLPAAGRFGGVYLPVLPGAGMIAASIAGACVLRRRRHAHGGGCDATCKKVR